MASSIEHSSDTHGRWHSKRHPSKGHSLQNSDYPRGTNCARPQIYFPAFTDSTTLRRLPLKPADKQTKPTHRSSSEFKREVLLFPHFPWWRRRGHCTRTETQPRTGSLTHTPLFSRNCVRHIRRNSLSMKMIQKQRSRFWKLWLFMSIRFCLILSLC